MSTDDVDAGSSARRNALRAGRRELVQRQLASLAGPPGAETARSVLSGAFAVLGALPFSPTTGQVSALARATALPRPTVHRMLHQLRDVGAVTDASGRWTLTAELMALTTVTEPTAGLRSAAASPMRLLRERTGATVSCVVDVGDRAFVLDVIPGRDPLPVDIFPGRTMPAGSAAVLVLDGAAPPRHNAVDREAVVPGLTCFATRVTLPDGRRAALQLSTPPSTPAETFASLVGQAAFATTRSITTRGRSDPAR